MLEHRAEEHMFKLSRYEGTLQKRSILASDDPYKILKKRRQEEAEFKLPQKEFTARQRYKDSDGNVLAPAIETDELYKSLLRHGKVDELDPVDATVGQKRIANVRGLPRKGGQRRDEMGTIGTYYGKVLMFVSLKRDGKLHKWPKGDIEFVDPSTDTIFSGVVVLQLTVPPRLLAHRWPPDVEYAAFMIGREALVNALQHASARQVSLTLDGDAGELRLSIRDDGVGIAPEARAGRAGHLGLVGMRERAFAIGARLHVDSTPGPGTAVELEWTVGDEQDLPDR